MAVVNREIQGQRAQYRGMAPEPSDHERMNRENPGQGERRRPTEKERTSGTAVRSLAHDLNNILATISLYAELALQDPELSPLTHERLETIYEQAQEGTDLVQILRRLSRP